MPVTELFNVATWNFVLGERDVEDALRDPTVRALIVRGGVGTVLPTVNAVRELEAREELRPKAIHVPSNGLSAALPDLGMRVEASAVLPRLLRDTYGVRVEDALPQRDDALVVAFLRDGGDAGVLREASRFPMVVGMPCGVAPSGLRDVARKAFSTFRYEGRNAFFPASVEEAALEVAPQHIVVLSDDPERLFYTAIGAVDFFLVQDARLRDPSTLQLWDILSMGAKVTAVLLASPRARSEVATVLEHACTHLQTALGVASCQPDYEYGPVSGHKIAIDLR
ncbi:MAG: hypothetical protein FJX76_19800 [Armatimonadetes bacterium]|nr:hypothetical protein [Armatimonadota bacterium]